MAPSEQCMHSRASRGEASVAAIPYMEVMEPGASSGERVAEGEECDTTKVRGQAWRRLRMGEHMELRARTKASTRRAARLVDAARLQDELTERQHTQLDQQPPPTPRWGHQGSERQAGSGGKETFTHGGAKRNGQQLPGQDQPMQLYVSLTTPPTPSSFRAQASRGGAKRVWASGAAPKTGNGARKSLPALQLRVTSTERAPAAALYDASTSS